MFPEFDGREAYGWLIMVEQHCESKGVSAEEKFLEAEKALTGEAFMWWFCWRRRNQKATWWEFVEALLRRFEPELEPYMPEPVHDSEEEEIPRKQEVLEAERRTVVVEAKPEANSVLLAKSEIKPYSPENSETEQTAEESRCQPVTVVDFIDCTLTAKGEKIDAEGEIFIKRLKEGALREKSQTRNLQGRKRVQSTVFPQITELGFDWKRRQPRKPPDSRRRKAVTVNRPRNLNSLFIGGRQSNGGGIAKPPWPWFILYLRQGPVIRKEERCCTPVNLNRPPERFFCCTEISNQTSVLCSSMVTNRLETATPDRSGGGSCFILSDSCRSDLVANRPPAKPPDLAETAVVGYCGLEFGVRMEKRKGSTLICTPVTTLRPPAKPPDLAVTAVEERKLKWGRYGFGYLPLAPCEVQARHVREVGPSEKAPVEPLSNPNGPSPIHSWKELEPGRRWHKKKITTYTFVKLCLSNLEQLVLVDTIRRTSHMVQEDPMIEEVKEDGTGGELRRKGEI